MNLINKLNGYKAGWFDFALIKIAVFAGALFVAKIWDPILSLDWYWYFVVWILAAAKPLLTFYKSPA